MMQNDFPAVERWLALWADWMRGETVGRGYPSRSVGLSTGGASEEFDSLCDRAEWRCCPLIDAAIREMPLVAQAAISHYWLASVFRLRSDPAAIYAAHIAELERRLRAHGVVV
jgi:hypothetical protein